MTNRAYNAIVTIAIIAVSVALCLVMFGCKTTDITDLIPSITNSTPDVVPGPTPDPTPDTSDWHNWGNAPDTLTPGWDYYRDGDGNFVYSGGGDGYFKPESDLWLVGDTWAEQVREASVYTDRTCSTPVLRNGQRVYFRWPGDVGPMSNKPTSPGNTPQGISHGNTSMYHNGQLKIRGVNTVRAGEVIGIIGLEGNVRAAKLIADPDCFQR